MTEQLFCDNHPATSAVGICAVCGKPVCNDCAITIDGKIFCNELTHSTLNGEFDELLATPTVFEMDILVRNLHANGIESRWFDSKKYDSNSTTKLFVKKDQSRKAIEILKNLDLLDFTTQHNYGK